MTIKEKLIQYFTKVRGETIITPSLSKKYTTLTRQKGGYYFIGPKGAIRAGKNVTTSVSLDHLRDQMLKEAV